MPVCAAAVRGARWPTSFSGGLQGKEARAAPGRPGDGARDRRQAGIGLPFPHIAFGRDRDGVAPALIVTDQHGSDLEVALGGTRTVAPGKAVEEFERDTVQRAKRLFLNPVGDHPSQQVRREVLRRRAAEHRLPTPSQRNAGQRPHMLDLRRDRGWIDKPLQHVRPPAAQRRHRCQ